MIILVLYLATIAGSLIYLVRSTYPDEVELRPPSDPKPVSIIIPARNKEAEIERCLRSLTTLEYPSTEIILVDGDSEDRTVEIANQFEAVTVSNN